MAPLDLDEELVRLYGSELDSFVSERTRLVRALRAEGRRAEATTVQELRKPSLPVWVVNQLSRRYRKDVDLLLDAGHRLAAAQIALLGGGDPGQFDEARRTEQQAVKRLHAAARALLGDRATTGTLDRVVTTLRAAAVSSEAREALARGNLTGELGPSGFEAFAGIQPAAEASGASAGRSRKPARDAADGKARKTAARREAIAAARVKLDAATNAEAALAVELRRAGQAVRRARTELEAAEGELRRLEAERAAAAGAVAEARSELEAARTVGL